MLLCSHNSMIEFIFAINDTWVKFPVRALCHHSLNKTQIFEICKSV